MIRKALLIRIFDASNMQRWNDMIRPVELWELDKQAHKMIFAYVLGKFNQNEKGFDWIEIIEGGIFEFFQRLIVTDIKPQIFHKIKGNQDKFRQLNEWVFKQLVPIIDSIGNDLSFSGRFRKYFFNPEDNINRKIVNFAHFLATKWEFDIIERFNPKNYEIDSIKKELEGRGELFKDLIGFEEIVSPSPIRNFIDLCGQLRFQIRWGHLPMIPRTSVLGHSLIVAILSYLFSLEFGACKRRLINNFFTGLFHDLPEVLTRDIISPVKKSIAGLEEILKEYEKKEMEEKIFKLIPDSWHEEMRLYTEGEFSSVIKKDGEMIKITSKEIQEGFNDDIYDPKDGELVKAMDDLSAFVEAFLAKRNGIVNEKLDEAIVSIKKDYKDKYIADLNFGGIYADFD
ncbi:MAG: HD domain-containing protein [Candidatus Aminicenantia bacterium]